ncbi:MAG: hypothetical protein K2W95_06710 [Candidatus Obscuribacterales bacterium]|nr:hypothetical protein [Candidatus Obscuribacterales bacterium]
MSSKTENSNHRSATATVSKPEAEQSAQKPITLAQGFLRNKFLHALIGFCLVNVFLSAVYSPAKGSINDQFTRDDLTKSVPAGVHKPWPWWLARGYITCQPKPDVIVFGSSQMGSAQATADAKFLARWIDVVTHRKIVFLEDQLKRRSGGAPSVLSLAIPGAMISDEYLITKTLIQRQKPSTIVITLAPRDFIDDTLPAPSATDQFKFFSQYVSLGPPLEAAAYPDFFARLDTLVKRMPLSQLGTTVHAAFKQDIAATSVKANDVLKALTSVASDPHPGQWVVPPTMPELWTDNTKEYKNRFKGPNMEHYSGQMQFFRAWLKELQSSGVRIVVVGMPSMKMNRDLLPDQFWTQFRKDVTEESRNHGASFVDLTDSEAFVKADYLDTVHLNARGAEKLFPLIADAVDRAR